MNASTLIMIAVALVAFFVFKQMGSAKPGEAKALLKKGARVIDVRTEAEFRAGHLKVAKNLPLGELKELIIREVPDKSTPILLHCASGARSGAGKRMLTEMGYQTVLNLGSFGRARSIVEE